MLLLGDCIERMGEIPDGSVDMVLCDPPYGTVQGLGDGLAVSHGMRGRTGWDEALRPVDFLPHCLRVLRTNGALILFAQEPYTSKLIGSATTAIPFCYRMAWVKDHFANSLVAKKAPVSYFEDVLVYRCKKGIDAAHDFAGDHPGRAYAANVLLFIGKNLKAINDELGHRRAEHFFYVGTSQFSLCTRAVYDEIEQTYYLRNMPGFREYADLKAEDAAFKASRAKARKAYLAEVSAKYPVTFNLPAGKRYKSNILTYRKDRTGHHPTQKPVALLEDLVRTYSDPGDTVLDFTMGSGSTGVACINTGRRFIGIERDEGYFAIAQRRIADAQPPLMAAE